MKNKFFALAAVVVLVGIIVAVIFKFNVGYSYKGHQLISIEIGQEFNENDIKAITNEVFPKQQVEIQSSGVYKDVLILSVQEVTDEQKNNLVTKLNEKYGIEKNSEEIKPKYIPSFRLRDVVKAYILPMALATVAVLLYLIIRFRKIGIKGLLIQFLGLNIMAEALYVSILAITRFPINKLVMPGAVAIYFAITIFLTCGYEKQLASKKDND